MVINVLSKAQILSNSLELGSNDELEGIYFLIKNKEIVYIGRSINPKSRINKHQKEKDFDSYIIQPTFGKNAAKLEGKYINKFSPKLNKTSHGDGRIAEGRISLQDFCNIMNKKYPKFKQICKQNSLGEKYGDKIILNKKEVLSLNKSAVQNEIA